MYADAFLNEIVNHIAEHPDVDLLWEQGAKAASVAAAAVPKWQEVSKQPWVSERMLELFQLRSQARNRNG
eukprot:6432210-Pyramimonas_sp.AAC.1